MSHPLPDILLFYPCNTTVSRLAELCGDIAADAHIVSVSSFEHAEQALRERSFAVVLGCAGDNALLARLVQLHAPRPVIALGYGLVAASQVTELLRAGVSDVFDLQALVEVSERTALQRALRLYLYRAQLIDQGERAREALELSLAELKADQKAALQIQKRMLPPARVELPGGVNVSYCLTPSLYLSGDFVDVIALDERFAVFYLADVSGHGASSALITVLLKNITHRLVRNFKRGSSFDILSPANALTRINRELLDADLGKHLTMFMGLLDFQTGRLSYAVGGHHPMPVLRADADTCFLKGRGMPLGLFEAPFFEACEIALPEAFLLALFSDGILEMLPASSLQEKEQSLLAQVSASATCEAESLKKVLTRGRMQDAPDDIAVMILSRSPG